jgi:hypothetical protein
MDNESMIVNSSHFFRTKSRAILFEENLPGFRRGVSFST